MKVNWKACCRASSMALLAVVSGAWAAGAEQLSIGKLRCEYATDPLGVDSQNPRLSWILTSSERGERQTAYQVLVASSQDKLNANQGDLWDTGKVASGQSVQVAYQGKTLVSGQRCYWKVRVWNRQGAATAFSPTAFWEVGLLSPSDWHGDWIGFPPGWNGRGLYFRNRFDVPKPVRSARLYIAGLGYSECQINGMRIGDHVLDPGTTDYGKRVLYSTYDVTATLHKGLNAIGVHVGNGWYGFPKLRLQLNIVYPDGTTGSLASSGERGQPAWMVAASPVVSNSIYDGEVYDARLEKPDWAQVTDTPQPGRDRTEEWFVAVPVDPPSGRLVSQMMEPIKVVDTIHPRLMKELSPGVFVFDGGQNLAGWAQLHGQGERGTRVTLRFAETLNKDGSVNQENLRRARCSDVYILKGGGPETWEPHFTYHGFRYVQVEGFPGKPDAGSIEIKVVRSAVEPAGTFETSNDLINRIHRMIWWTEASNMHSIPTDCPQRDERMGWMNDPTARLEEAFYNFQVARFYSKFSDDVEDTQEADGTITDTVPWKIGMRPADPVSASYMLMGWFAYQHYGDTRILERHYDSYRRWVDFLGTRSEDGLMKYGYYGDWSPPEAFSMPNGSANSKDTPNEFMSTGYYLYCSRMLSDMAAILNKPEDQQRYAAQAKRIEQAFNRKYWNPETGSYAANNQAENSFGLFLGVAPDPRRAVRNLAADVEKRGWHLTTGNLCTKYVMEMLAQYGYAAAAYRIATQETYPSWGFMLRNGATTLWERWEMLTGGGMNSHNHPMMGSVGSWFYKYLAGIQPAPRSPGFQQFVIHPYLVDGLAWVRATHETMYGTIRSEWHNNAGAVTLSVTVPVNTTATIYVPARDAAEVRIDQKPAPQIPEVRLAGREDGVAVFEVGSGSYTFASTR